MTLFPLQIHYLSSIVYNHCCFFCFLFFFFLCMYMYIIPYIYQHRSYILYNITTEAKIKKSHHRVTIRFVVMNTCPAFLFSLLFLLLLLVLLLLLLLRLSIVKLLCRECPNFRVWSNSFVNYSSFFFFFFFCCSSNY